MAQLWQTKVNRAVLGVIGAILTVSCTQVPADIYLRNADFTYSDLEAQNGVASNTTAVRAKSRTTEEDGSGDSERLRVVEDSIKRHSNADAPVKIVPRKETVDTAEVADNSVEPVTDSSRVKMVDSREPTGKSTNTNAATTAKTTAATVKTTVAGRSTDILKDNYRLVTIREGDTLLGLANEYQVASKDIIALNDLQQPYVLKIGLKLKVPFAAEQIYIVEPGDNLSYLAQKFNLSVAELVALNDLQAPYGIYIGQRLKVSKGTEDVKRTAKTSSNTTAKSSTATKTATSTAKKTYYTVQPGDNLYFIARQYNCTIQDLIKLNQLKEPYSIYPKQKLVVPAEAKATSTIASNSNTAKPIAKVATTKTASKSNVAKSDAEVNQQVANLGKRNSKAKFIWPLKGRVLERFGKKSDGAYNDGIKIAAPEGTPFRAIDDGIVVYVGDELKDYGNLIIIQHDSQWISAYGHSKMTAVYKGQEVRRNQIIGYVGKEGNVAESQLYLGLRYNNKPVNPESYLK